MTRPVPASLSPAHHALLMRLLELPTVNPLETPLETARPLVREAQLGYAAAAQAMGFTIVHHASATPGELDRDDIPLAVRDAVRETPGFLECQPSLVLRLGPALPPAATVMFNVHLDTVAGWQTPKFDAGRYWGRGAVDAKGPAVALLAGIEAALAAEPALGTRTAILIQAVAGEEGGAMGVYGTRPLVERGFTGRLNVFCEPTRRRYLPRATASMTACLRVEGEDAIDDNPGAGHNASVLLGFLAQHLAAVLPGSEPGSEVCIAGLHTGMLHNRVYGSGRLLLNASYGSAESGRRLEAATQAAVADGLAEFSARFRRHRDLARTATDAAAVTRLEWLKRGLPALSDAGPQAERLLTRTFGSARWADSDPAFTCDAIWMEGVPGAATVVFGPGGLAEGNAHADGEHVDLSELEGFASDVARVLVAFASDVTTECDGNR